MTTSNTSNLATCKILFSCYRKQKNHKGHRSQLLSRMPQVCGDRQWSLSSCLLPQQTGRSWNHLTLGTNENHRKVCVGLKSKIMSESETNMAELYLQPTCHKSRTVSYGFCSVHSWGNKLVSCYQTVHGFRVKMGFWVEGMVLCFKMLFLMSLQSSAFQNRI